MNKILQVIFLFLFFCNFAVANEENKLSNEEQEYLSKNNTFTYTGDPNWLPYEAFDKQGKYIGIVAEHLKLIEKNTNLEFKKVVSRDWSDALDIAVSGKADIISGDAADALLNKQFLPIETYLKNPIIVVMKNSENFILDINDIKDGKIAIIKDYGYTADIYKKYPNITFYELENIQESLECVSSGECKAMLASYALANYSINKYKYFDLKVVGSTEVKMNVTLFVNKEKTLLHSIINKSMKSISMSDHKNILAKWNKTDEPWINYQFLNELIVMTLLFIAIILSLLYWQANKRRKTQDKNQKLQADLETNLKELNESRKIAKIGIWTLYHNDNKLVWNEDTYGIFGIDDKEKVATVDDFFGAIHEDDMQQVSDAFSNHLVTKEAYFITHRLLTVKNQELKYVNEWCKTDFDDTGNPLISHGIIQDITESRANEILIQKQNKDMIEQSRKAQKQLTESLVIFGDNVIASNSDLNGIITYASKALCDISGYTQDELLGQPHSILRHPSTKSELFKDLWSTIQSGKTWHGELQNTKKDSGSYWVRTRISPELNDDNKIIGYSSIRENITPEKIKEQFLANMSHEIRTPLNAIIGFIDILAENETEPEKLQYLNTINSSSHSLTNIINDILDFSKIESGKLDIEYINFDPKYELEITKELFQAKCKEKNINLVVNYKDLPHFLNGDILRIKQVVSNILSNAIKFTPEYKSIFLSIEYKNDTLDISVRDEGIGITKEYQKTIFESFSQADNSTTRKYGGTGLGLSISYNLVQLMGGELKLKSEIDKGSEFYFSLPLKLGNKVKVSSEILNQVFSKLTLLLVEDNTANQLFMKVILKKMSINFDIANDGLEAIEAFKNNKYDVILMDENMPNMNGIEATKNILKIEEEQELKHTPIIALTANALKGDKEKFLNAGMDEYLTKPINKTILSEMLGRVFI